MTDNMKRLLKARAWDALGLMFEGIAYGADSEVLIFRDSSTGRVMVCDTWVDVARAINARRHNPA